MKIIFGIILIVLSFAFNKNLKETVNKSESEQYELIVQKILDLPKLQWIYHSESKQRLPVKILETKLITKNFNLNKFGKKVRVLSISELENERIKDYVIFDKIEIEKETTYFEINYKIEGVGCNGKLLKKNNEWEVFEYSVKEK